MNRTERLARCDSIADFFVNNDTHGGVDRILFAFAPAAEDDACSSDVFAIDRCHISALNAGHINAMLCVGSRAGSSITLISPPCNSTIWRNLSNALPDAMICSESSLPSATVFDAPPKKKHPCRQMEAEFAQILRSTAVQDLDALLDFERIAYHMAEWLAHVGDERNHLLAHALASFYHEFREENCIFLVFS